MAGDQPPVEGQTVAAGQCIGPVRRLRVHNHDVVSTAKTYSEARPGEPFVYVGSMGYLEVGVREARADKLLGARPGMRVETI